MSLHRAILNHHHVMSPHRVMLKHHHVMSLHPVMLNHLHVMNLVMRVHHVMLNHHHLVMVPLLVAMNTDMKRGNMQLLPHILTGILINADLMIDMRHIGVTRPHLLNTAALLHHQIDIVKAPHQWTDIVPALHRNTVLARLTDMSGNAVALPR